MLVGDCPLKVPEIVVETVNISRCLTRIVFVVRLPILPKIPELTTSESLHLLVDFLPLLLGFLCAIYCVFQLGQSCSWSLMFLSPSFTQTVEFLRCLCRWPLPPCPCVYSSYRVKTTVLVLMTSCTSATARWRPIAFYGQNILLYNNIIRSVYLAGSGKITCRLFSRFGQNSPWTI